MNGHFVTRQQHHTLHHDTVIVLQIAISAIGDIVQSCKSDPSTVMPWHCVVHEAIHTRVGWQSKKAERQVRDKHVPSSRLERLANRGYVLQTQD